MLKDEWHAPLPAMARKGILGFHPDACIAVS